MKQTEDAPKVQSVTLVNGATVVLGGRVQRAVTFLVTFQDLLNLSSAASLDLPPPAEPVSSITADLSRQGATCHANGRNGAIYVCLGAGGAAIVPIIWTHDRVCLDINRPAEFVLLFWLAEYPIHHLASAIQAQL